MSLSALGLKMPGGLDCPAGGAHHVPMRELHEAQHTGSGTVRCVKCRQVLEVSNAGR